MGIWFKQYNINEVVKSFGYTMLNALDIEVYELGQDYIKGKMPVDKRHVQPMRMLHGGASVVLAESLGSIGANLIVDPSKKACVGLSINANHIRPVMENTGYVYGVAKPVHTGRTTQVWDIDVTNEAGKIVCTCKLTMAVINK